MIYPLNQTHDPLAQSWVASANAPDADFPIQNLPFGVFRRGAEPARIGVAIGDQVLDLRALFEDIDIFDNVSPFINDPGIMPSLRQACVAETLNPLMALTPRHWSQLRQDLFHLLHSSAGTDLRERLEPRLLRQSDLQMQLPARIGDYTDFYAGIHHARNVGSLFRPENPLLPNYKWVPIAYHGRSSSVVVSGSPVRRPQGQTKSVDSESPSFGPTRRLDYELELGIFSGPGNTLGEPIAIDDAENHIFGLCLLNDWSARDVQAWEYQPLGPFLAKNFVTSISPWVVTLEALAPFRIPAYARPAGDPNPLPYLASPRDQEGGGIDIQLEILLSTARMRERRISPQRLSLGSARDLYWTMAQFVTHHTSNGCNLRPGDLLGSGTISGASKDSLGSLLELTQGKNALELESGEKRTFLEDGDEVILRGWCEGGAGKRRIGFGECRGMIRDLREQT